MKNWVLIKINDKETSITVVEKTRTFQFGGPPGPTNLGNDIIRRKGSWWGRPGRPGHFILGAPPRTSKKEEILLTIKKITTDYLQPLTNEEPKIGSSWHQQRTLDVETIVENGVRGQTLFNIIVWGTPGGSLKMGNPRGYPTPQISWQINQVTILYLKNFSRK